MGHYTSKKQYASAKINPCICSKEDHILSYRGSNPSVDCFFLFFFFLRQLNGYFQALNII